MTGPVTVLQAALLTFFAACSVLACGPQASPAPQAQPPAEQAERFELLGQSGPVAMGRVRLGASQALRVPASACQEVLLFIEKGAVHHAEYGWLRHGDAARFHAQTLLEAAPVGQTRVFAALVRDPSVDAEPPTWKSFPDAPACPRPAVSSVRTDPASSGPFVHAEGKLRVQVYLDARDDPGALGSLGTLDADPTQPVPEHLHSESAEVLWIVDGAGTLHLGDDRLAIQPGTFVFVPPGTLHRFVPAGTRPLFAYQLYAPPGPEQRFKQPK